MSDFFPRDALNRFTCAVTGITPSEHLDVNGLQRFSASLRILLNTHLTYEERESLMCAFGLRDGLPYTVSDIAKILSFTHQQTEALVENALQKFRQRCKDPLRYVLGTLSIERSSS